MNLALLLENVQILARGSQKPHLPVVCEDQYGRVFHVLGAHWDGVEERHVLDVEQVTNSLEAR